MSIYYKFKSAKNYDILSLDNHFISVGDLKERIFFAKHLERGTDFDLIVTNAQSNEEYLDELMSIPRNTSVLIRRIPGLRNPIILQPDKPSVEPKVDDQLATSNAVSGSTAGSSVVTNLDASDFDDEFGGDPYAIAEDTTKQSRIIMRDSTASTKADEDSKIKALVESSSLDWQRQAAGGFLQGRGFAKGRGVGFLQRTPPEGYVCRRCKTPGHFIHHCPTNGDPNYDIRKVKPASGIPKTMLVPTTDGFYALPSGTSAVLKPDEAAFEKEIEGIPSTRTIVDLPPELHCPLCKEVMKNAVFTSKCCYRSYCDKCIRDYIISKSMCACEAKNILADDLLPNTTVRATINRILESNTSTSDNTWSGAHVLDMESALCDPPKIPSPISKEEQKPLKVEEPRNVEGIVAGHKANELLPQTSQKESIIEIPAIAEVTPAHESGRVNGHQSQSGARLVEKVEQKLDVGSEGKKKKKVSLLRNGMPAGNHPNSSFPGADMQWTNMQPGMGGYVGPSNYNGYWQQMADVRNMPYNTGNYQGPMHIPSGNVMPPESYWPQNYMTSSMVPHPSQRYDAAQFHMRASVQPPFPRREELEPLQVNVRRKEEMEKQFDNRMLPGDRNVREHNSNSNTNTNTNTNVASMEPKSNLPRDQRSPSPDGYERDRSRGHRQNLPRGRKSLSPDRYNHDHSRRQKEWSPLHPVQNHNGSRPRERSPLFFDENRNRIDHRQSSYRHQRDGTSLERRESDTHRRSLKRKAEYHHSDCPRDCKRDHERDQNRDRDPYTDHRQSSYSHQRGGSSLERRECNTSRQSLKNKAEYHHSDFSRDRERDHGRKLRPRNYHHQSEKEQANKGNLSLESKYANKVCEADESGGSRRHQHKTSSSLVAEGNNHDDDDHETGRKNIATASMDYESSDDDQHFKRKRRKH